MTDSNAAILSDGACYAHVKDFVRAVPDKLALIQI